MENRPNEPNEIRGTRESLNEGKPSKLPNFSTNVTFRQINRFGDDNDSVDEETGTTAGKGGRLLVVLVSDSVSVADELHIFELKSGTTKTDWRKWLAFSNCEKIVSNLLSKK